MTEEDLVAIEQLMNQRIFVNLPVDEWSSAMTKAMLDKIPLLIAEVRMHIRGRQTLLEAAVKHLEELKSI